MTVVRNLMVRAGADFSSLRTQMKKAQKNITEFKSGVQSAVKGIGASLAGLGIGVYIADATRSAMDVEASMMQINRIMGDSAKEFKDWADTSALSYNMSSAAATKYGAIFGNLVSTFSSGAKDTEQKTVDLLKTSAVVASGTGRTIEDVMWRIRSGLLGNTEAIEDLGINVYVNMLKSTQAFKQFAGDKSWDQLDFKTQQLIRYYAILEQANRKFGAEVNQNTNTALQRFTASLGNLKVALGSAFMPILNAILPALTAFVNAIARAASYVAQFFRVLFGYKDPSKTLKKTQGAVTSLGTSYDNVGKAATGAASGISKAAKAAEKAKKSFGLASIDEINNIANSSSGSKGSSGGSGGAGAGGGGATDTGIPPLPEPGNVSAFGEVSDKIKKIAGKIRAVFLSLRDFIQKHKDLIVSLVAGMVAGIVAAFLIVNWKKMSSGIILAFGRISKAVKAAWMAITGPVGLVVAAIAAVVAIFVYFYRTNKSFRGFVDKILKDIGNAAIWLWKNAMVPLGKFVGKTLVAAWDALKSAIEWLWKNVLVPVGKYITDVFLYAWNKLKSGINTVNNDLQPLIATLKDIWKNVIVPFAKELMSSTKPAFDSLSKTVSTLWKSVLVPLGQFIGSTFKPIISALSAVVSTLWKSVFSPLAKFLTATLKPAVKAVSDTILFLYKYAFIPMTKYVSGTVQSVFRSIGSAISGLKTAFNGLINFIKGVFTGNWRKAWYGLKSIFSGVFKALWSIAKAPLNAVIRGINAVIGGLNKLKIKIPKWVPVYGGKSFGINIPKIPYLASGGYIGANNPMLAVIGDNMQEGEIVAPESKIYEQTLRAVTDALKNAGGQEIVINIGGTTVFRKIIQGINKAQRQAGKTLIQV